MLIWIHFLDVWLGLYKVIKYKSKRGFCNELLCIHLLNFGIADGYIGHKNRLIWKEKFQRFRKSWAYKGPNPPPPRKQCLNQTAYKHCQCLKFVIGFLWSNLEQVELSSSNIILYYDKFHLSFDLTFVSNHANPCLWLLTLHNTAWLALYLFDGVWLKYWSSGVNYEIIDQWKMHRE